MRQIAQLLYLMQTKRAMMNTTLAEQNSVRMQKLERALITRPAVATILRVAKVTLHHKQNKYMEVGENSSLLFSPTLCGEI